MYSPAEHLDMVISLALPRATLRMSKSRMEMNDYLQLEMVIAFDELREEHRWAWMDLDELRAAHTRELERLEKSMQRSLNKAVRQAQVAERSE
jgi:hypothetical protein